MSKKDQVFDFVIAGSGFGGSILAMGLVKSGYRVCLIERDSHPRFSIGESSTPIADMVFRDISKKYNLPFLHSLSRFGTWQRIYPEVACGLKRGFSYCYHEKEKMFNSNKFHKNELLDAASMDDENSDTNWFRSDIDSFLVNQSKIIGVKYLDHSEIVKIKRISNQKTWIIHLNHKSGFSNQIQTTWIVDATGSPLFSNTFFGTRSTSEDFETHSRAIYSHFSNVAEWQSYLIKNSFAIRDYPFNPDFSALHHILEEGWMWMLRFNNGLLSAGIVLEDTYKQLYEDPEEVWIRVLETYPSIKMLFKNSEFADVPGKILKTDRLQRRLDCVTGEGWVALSHTAGFVDPLHSTGIAHTLVSVEKLLTVFNETTDEEKVHFKLKKYQDEIFKELEFIDLIVSSGYLSRHNFPLFSAAVTLYFIASVRYEQLRLRGIIPKTFLCAGEADLYDCISTTQKELKLLSTQPLSKENILAHVDKIRKRIAPYNSVGLLDPKKNNMYTHTAVTL